MANVTVYKAGPVAGLFRKSYRKVIIDMKIALTLDKLGLIGFGNKILGFKISKDKHGSAAGKLKSEMDKAAGDAVCFDYKDETGETYLMVFLKGVPIFGMLNCDLKTDDMIDIEPEEAAHALHVYYHSLSEGKLKQIAKKKNDLIAKRKAEEEAKKNKGKKKGIHLLPDKKQEKKKETKNEEKLKEIEAKTEDKPKEIEEAKDEIRLIEGSQDQNPSDTDIEKKQEQDNQNPDTETTTPPQDTEQEEIPASETVTNEENETFFDGRRIDPETGEILDTEEESQKQESDAEQPTEENKSIDGREDFEAEPAETLTASAADKEEVPFITQEELDEAAEKEFEMRNKEPFSWTANYDRSIFNRYDEDDI